VTFAASFNASGGARWHADAVSLSCLIVDDSASFLQAAQRLLERQGLTVAGVASTAAEALQQARELRPDVVLVDLVLGDASGFDLARRLADWGARRPTVILVSTHAESDFADLIAEAPAAGFLPKAELSADAIRRLAPNARPGT
jgi:CheY-like chemotaxis protein